jgi:hypothetical protein
LQKQEDSSMEIPHFTMFQRRRVLWLALTILLLALAACSPGGGASSTGGNPPASTQPPAPIHVPQGYQGLISVSFSANTTYEQARASVEQAGLKLAVPCPNGGPIVADATPKPTDQRDTFAETRKLTAAGSPTLTQTMLTHIAASSGVTSVDSLPHFECPLSA